MWAGLYPDFDPIFPQAGKWIVSLNKEPRTNSPKVGELVIEFVNGRGFTFTYVSQKAEKISFKPDLYESDWGYGPYYHQTILSLQNEWVLLPKIPFENKVWANLKEPLGGFDIKTIEQGMIYKLDNRSIYIIKTDKNSVTVRDEQEADMWCEGGNPPPIEKYKPETILFEDLYDVNKHLKLKVKYTRGC